MSKLLEFFFFPFLSFFLSFFGWQKFVIIYLYSVCLLCEWNVCALTFKRRIKPRLPFAGIIRSSPYSPHFQDKGYIEIV